MYFDRLFFVKKLFAKFAYTAVTILGVKQRKQHKKEKMKRETMPFPSFFHTFATLERLAVIEPDEARRDEYRAAYSRWKHVLSDHIQ